METGGGSTSNTSASGQGSGSLLPPLPRQYGGSERELTDARAYDFTNLINSSTDVPRILKIRQVRALEAAAPLTLDSYHNINWQADAYRDDYVRGLTQKLMTSADVSGQLFDRMRSAQAIVNPNGYLKARTQMLVSTQQDIADKVYAYMAKLRNDNRGIGGALYSDGRIEALGMQKLQQLFAENMAQVDLAYPISAAISK